LTQYELLQQKIKEVCLKTDPTEFFCDFLRSYNIPKATIARMNIVSGIPADVGIKVSNKLLFVYSLSDNLYTKFDFVQRNIIRNQVFRLVMLMNTRDILALDTSTNEWLSVTRRDLYKDCDFFLPLMGLEKITISDRQNVNVQIGEKFAQFYNEMHILNHENEQNLNRLIVCLVCSFLADSFGLIENGSLQKWVSLYSKEDGSDLNELLYVIFSSIRDEDSCAPEYIKKLVYTHIENMPYVEPGLCYDRSTRNLLLDISKYDWSEVEPEVLGSLIQSIVFPTESGSAYNYTSTANIYKVIGPLFMDDLYEEFELQKKYKTVNTRLLDKLSSIAIFDPACGTGNFLMVTYRELKKLEYHIKTHLTENEYLFEDKEYVDISQFFGIDNNPVAISITQIGMAFTARKYTSLKSEYISLSLPDKNIISDFALSVDWTLFCPRKNKLVYIIGNPPYKGARAQSDKQKEIMKEVFADEISNGMKIGDLDFASAYFYLAAKYIKGTKGGFAFVSTNSLTQGVHVPVLWPVLFKQGISIFFAYTSFKWKNEGCNNTAVTVVIIGCREASNSHYKTIYNNNLSYSADEISPYLTKGNVIVQKENRGPICSWLPKMIKGNMPYGKDLLLSPREKDELVTLYPEARKFLRRVVGSYEFIHGEERWCLWISDNEVDEASSVPLIADRLESVRTARLRGDANAKRLAERPHQFRETNMPKKYTLVVPSVSSENRSYFQIGYVGKNVVVTNLCFVIYDAEPWVFGVIASKMHNLWVRTVCGGLETRPRYSNVLGYNTFPIPELTYEQKQDITEAVYGIIMERENNSEMSLMELYNEDTMPEGLRYAHKVLDLVVERCYKPEGFYSNQERLDSMFLLYKQVKGE
jgi:hypothetical protein